MKKLIIKIGLSCVVLAFLFVLLFPLSQISQLHVQLGDSNQQGVWFQKKQPQILAVLQTYKQKYLWQISLKELVQKLQEIDKELDFRIKRKYPGQLTVFVYKKKTALLLLDSNSHFYAVSYKGVVGIKRTKDLDFPILRGPDFEKSLNLRQQLLKIVEVLPVDKAWFCWDNLSEILYNKENQSFLFYLKFPRFVLELDSSPSDKKKQNIEFVLNYLNKQNRTQAFVTVKSDKKIIVKNKK